MTNGSLAPGPQITVVGAGGSLDEDARPLELESLRPRGSTAAARRVRAARRGVFTLPPLQVETEDPIGLVHTRRTAGGRQAVVVTPRLVRLDSCAPLAHLRGGDRRRGSSSVTFGGSELRGVRPHYPGEPLNHVDWKATARTGTLMLREMEEPAAGGVSVVLDGTAAGDRRREDHGFEVAVQIAGSVADFALRAGLDVDLTVLGAELRHTALPSATDSGRRLRHALATATANGPGPTAESLRRLQAAEQTTASDDTLVVVIRSLDREVARVLAGLRRRGGRVAAVVVDSSWSAAQTVGGTGRRSAAAAPTDTLVSLAAADVPCIRVRAGDDLRAALSLEQADAPRAAIS